jgi:hypothetical protein
MSRGFEKAGLERNPLYSEGFTNFYQAIARDGDAAFDRNIMHGDL